MTKAKTPIRAALLETSTLKGLVKDGMQAVEDGHRDYFDPPIRAAFADSLELDEAMRKGQETENRWDYLLGHEASETVVAVEPHTASDKAITVLIAKRAAARDQLRPHLRPSSQIHKWLWVASGKVGFTQMEKAIRRLDQNGIEFAGKRVLAKHLPPAKKSS